MHSDEKQEASLEAGSGGQNLNEAASPELLLDKDVIEKLGRERPSTFPNRWIELCFCFSLLSSELLAEYFVSGFNNLLPHITTALDIPPESQTWPASVFSLVTGAFLLPAARLADIYGARLAFNVGLVWFIVWSFIAGWSTNYNMLIVCRALQGLGPSFFLPSGIMLIGSIYRPGPRKNLVFSLYGAFSPFGFYSGICVSGLAGHYLTWKWYFYIGCMIVLVVLVVSLTTMPLIRLRRHKSTLKMDWWGCATIVPALLLLVFAITDGSHAPDGWRTPYVLVTFILGILLLGAAFYVEGWVAAEPLLPFDLFKVKYMSPLFIALSFSYGVFGIYLFYASFYIQNILGHNSLISAAWFAPMGAGGIILATVGGFTLHLLPGKLLLLISGAGYLISMLLFAIIPDNPNYWAYVFPAMVCATIGVDIGYSVSNIFITTNLPQNRQGVAGAIINTIVFVGISFFLGLADLVVAQTEYLGEAGSYKAAFWFGVACSGVAIVLLVFIRVGKAQSDLTVEERIQLQEVGGRMGTGVNRPLVYEKLSNHQ
ncbi:major facilitator superfamily-domain-containing protein [Aspergillus undulatus]|uniref:major facilitator superfamily-domain-containing protein n=1 Tax=Aspergillus undulatus TaxID=1810928 RepID=UPI003CCD4C93